MRKILIESFLNFQRHGVPRFAAAIAFYMIFCLAPIFVLTISILSSFLHNVDTSTSFFAALEQLFGSQAITFLQTTLPASAPELGVWLTVLGTGAAFLGATAVFKELKCGLDIIFEAPAPTASFITLAIRHLAAFGTMLVIGLFLLTSLLTTMAASITATYFQSVITINNQLLELMNFSFSFLVLTAFFMVLYTFVPDTKRSGHLTLLGSVITALLFTVGKTAFGIYLGTVAVGSAYGAAGSLLVLLLWIFYSAQIFFLGAEITAALQNKKQAVENENS